MRPEWVDTSLGDVVEIRHGFPFDGKYFRDEPPGDVLLTPGNFAIGGGFKGDKLKYYDGPVPGEFVLREGDLIVTMTDLSKESATLGYPAFVPAASTPCRYLHNQRLGKVVPKGSGLIHLRYLHYLMRTGLYRHEVLASATGTTVKHTSPDRIMRFRFRRPPLDQQRAIAHILGTLDDKIELNRRMSETLETMARALFKSWFVDFEPVRAKVDGRDAGLPPEVAALFPDGFEDSEVREIPVGWRVSSVGDLCDRIENGGTPRRMERTLWGGSIPWFKSGELTDGPLVASEESITEEGLAESSCAVWAVGTVLIALYASPTVGRLGILEVPAAANQACSGLLAKPEYGSQFLFHALLATRDRLQQIAVGAAQQNISQRVVRNHRILVPPPVVARTFHDSVGVLYRRTVASSLESRTLAALRDTLLPKVISGDLRIEDDDRSVPSGVT